jgi:hypothetical protein
MTPTPPRFPDEVHKDAWRKIGTREVTYFDAFLGNQARVYNSALAAAVAERDMEIERLVREVNALIGENGDLRLQAGTWTEGWKAGRDAAQLIAQDTANEAEGAEYYIAVKIAQDIHALTPPAEPAAQKDFVSLSCGGETCSLCGKPATKKVGEEILSDDPHPARHNMTAYVCAEHFQMIFSPAEYRRVHREVHSQPTEPQTPPSHGMSDEEIGEYILGYTSAMVSIGDKRAAGKAARELLQPAALSVPVFTGEWLRETKKGADWQEAATAINTRLAQAGFAPAPEKLTEAQEEEHWKWLAGMAAQRLALIAKEEGK